MDSFKFQDSLRIGSQTKTHYTVQLLGRYVHGDDQDCAMHNLHSCNDEPGINSVYSYIIYL